MKKNKRLSINLSTIGENGRSIQGRLPSSIFEIKSLNYLECSRPIDYNLDISIVTHSVLIKGRVKTLIKRQCDRCLTMCDCTIENIRVCHYIPVTDEKIIDFTDQLREDILITFPQRFICAESCLGLCEYCGEDLNSDVCKCTRKNESDNIWDKLNELKL